METGEKEAGVGKETLVTSKEGDRLSISLSNSKRILTIEQLMAKAQMDPSDWIIDRAVVNKWDVAAFDKKRKKFVPFQNFQVKVQARPNPGNAINKQLRDDLVKDLRLLSPIVLQRHPSQRPLLTGWAAPFKPDEESHLLEIDIFDAHLGKLAIALESGDEYNIQIACDRFREAIKKLVKRASGWTIDRILFPIGNDFFNSDTHTNTTTAGTPQHEAARWKQTFRAGCQLIIETVQYLTEFAPVDVVVVQGNHDIQRAFYLGEVVEAYFHNNQNVTVDNSYKKRKYYRYGKSAVMFAHGNDEKATELNQIWAAEEPQLWADTLYREAHLGHFHHTKTIVFKPITEFKGLTARYLRSISATDAWHYEKGYVGNVKSAQSFIWSRTTGLIGQNYVNF